MEGKLIGNVLRLVDSQGQPINSYELVLKTTTQMTSRDMRVKYADGSLINVYVSIAPVKLGFGKEGKDQAGFVILVRDITREKSLEEERDEFISVVSHELRTPITIAEGNIGNAQVIAENSGDMTKIKEALKQSHEQILFLSNMINDLSTLSRAERGKLEVDIEPINVHELLNELLANYQPQAEKKNLQFSVEPAPTLEVLNSAKLYVREILQNFITNAIKYTENGGVTLKAEPRGAGSVIFKVVDTGIGISKQDQEKVFDKFFRSEDFRTRKVNGTGLGLYVTMKLARLIKAEISLESELNKGSTFSIFIPSLR
jgi:signal transduction histidine kinase